MWVENKLKTKETLLFQKRNKQKTYTYIYIYHFKTKTVHSTFCLAKEKCECSRCYKASLQIPALIFRDPDWVGSGLCLGVYWRAPPQFLFTASVENY